MYQEEITVIGKGAAAKAALLRSNPLGYALSSMLAGMFIGFGVLLAFTVGGALSASGSPAVKLAMGVSFGIALSLVIIGGAELFTGNNLVMTIGSLNRTVSWRDTVRVWVVCFLFNLLGSILTGCLFYLTGLASGPVGEFIAATAQTKMCVPPLPLFLRGVFCNILVCLAVWCSFRCKSESGKLIMVFWCLFAFITTGFEHSVANMTLLTIGLLAPFGADVDLLGYVYNIGIVTLGNMAGAIFFLALPYHLAGKKKEA